MRRNRRSAIRTLPLTAWAQVPAVQATLFGSENDTVSVNCST